MAIFPITEEVSIQEVVIVERGINFLYDFDMGNLVLKDGKFIELTGDAAVVFWIEKTLRTEHERATVYKNTGYGTKLEGLRGTVLPKEIARNILETNIREALLVHERIESINNFTVTQENDKVFIYFEIKLNLITEETEEIYSESSSKDGYTRLSTLAEIVEFLNIKVINSTTFSTTIEL